MARLNIKIYKIEEEKYILDTIEGDGVYFRLTKIDETGELVRININRNFRNILRAIISDYEVPSPADRAYRMEGHFFTIRVTEKDTIVDFIYNWRKDVQWMRFESEEAALLWILYHFKI